MIYAKEDSEDRILAEDLRQQLTEVVHVQMLSIDEIAAVAERNRWKQALVIKTPVFIISEASTSTAQRRKALVSANPVLGHLNFRSYYICRGITPLKLLERYEELSRLANEAMIVGEESRALLIRDLIEYAHSQHSPTLKDLLKTIAVSFRFLVAGAADLIGFLAGIAFFLGFPAGIVLAILYALGIRSSFSDYLILLTVFAAGCAFHMIETLEIWPWLGRRWKPERKEPKEEANGSTFSASDLEVPLSTHRLARRWAARYGYFAFGVLLGPSAVTVFTYKAPSILWILAAAVLGLTCAPFKTWGHQLFARFEAGQRGLLDTSLERFDSHVGRLSVRPMPDSMIAFDPEDLKLFDQRELESIGRWLHVAQLGAISAVHRPWRPPRDTVFISYVWADDPQTRLAEKLSETLDKLTTTHFLDKRHIPSGFVGWRSHVALELSRATHVLLIITPNIARGKFIAQEIRAIMHRWYFEVLPSVICVVERDVAKMLMEDKTVPLELRFLLAWCPNLTFTEAQDAQVLDRLIRQRRRNGRFKDWLVLLGGRSSERRAVAELMQ